MLRFDQDYDSMNECKDGNYVEAKEVRFALEDILNGSATEIAIKVQRLVDELK